MKEIYLLIIALMLSSVILSAPERDGDWILHRGELRMWELHAEADSLKVRSLIFARYSIDSWLYDVNGSACYADPSPPNGSAFLDMLSEDWAMKGFSYRGYVSYSIFRSKGQQKTDPLFGGSCREGGIGLKVAGKVDLIDNLLRMEADRNFRSQACQPTAYFLLRDILSYLESETSRIVRRSFLLNKNLSDALDDIESNLRQLVPKIRAELLSEGIDLRLYYYTKFIPRGKGEEISFVFNAIVRDDLAEYIHLGKILRKFYCIRKWEIKVDTS